MGTNANSKKGLKFKGSTYKIKKQSVYGSELSVFEMELILLKCNKLSENLESQFTDSLNC